MKKSECDLVKSASWKVLDKHVDNSSSLVKHQLDSFDSFVSLGIDQVISSYNPVEVTQGPFENGKPAVRYSVELSPISVGRCITHDKYGKSSVLLPNDARLRNLTYGAQLAVDLNISSHVRGENGDVSTTSKKISGVTIGTIPIMIGSKYCTLRDKRFINTECPYDPSGYFIVNGNEKVLVSLDRIGENKTYVFSGAKNSSSDSLMCEVRSVDEKNPGCPKTTSLNMSMKPSPHGNVIRATVNSIRVDLPISILFRSLGIETDKRIVDVVCSVAIPMGLSRTNIEKDIRGSLADGCIVYTEQDALLHIYKYTTLGISSTKWSTPSMQMASVRHLIQEDLFPHAGKDPWPKALYLAYMICKLLRVKHGISQMDDRDSYVNKRIDSPGALMTALFRQHYSKFVREMRSTIHKEMQSGAWRTTGQAINILNINNVYKVLRSSVITSGMTYALATGNWGVKNSKTCKQGVAQVLNRMTFNATISHLRRINTRIEKTGKLVQPRKLHTTHWGIVCLSETPEGSSIGLVKNLALTACITLHSSPRPVIKAIENAIKPVDELYPSNDPLIIINGSVIGNTKDPLGVSKKVRGLKRKGEISPYTSVVWDSQAGEVRINTEAGRCCRPVLTIDEDGRPSILKCADQIDKFTLSQLTIGTSEIPSVIEYIDVDESDHSLIAMRPSDLSNNKSKWTHLELDPIVSLGAVAATIPFSHHNQSPRNTYQCAMAKQAIGVYNTKYRGRLDTMAHVLDYPQIPIVNTKIAKKLQMDSMPSGVNAIVAIATHTGFNQEDSLIFNQSAIDRGLFSSTFYRTYKENNSRNHSTGEEEYYYNPMHDVNTPATLKAFNYNKLDKTGFVPENTFVDSNDIIIGKCMPHKHNGVIITRDCSVPIKNNENGFIDLNCYNDNRFPTSTADGYVFCKVRVRSTRKPTIGDKLSSRHGQKGTIGIVRAEQDMPVTINGIIPDLIINPHAIPSRMTVGQLMECVAGKKCCMTGEYDDSTPFSEVSIDNIGKMLEQFGMDRYGNEVMVSGCNGNIMNVNMFIGPTYYQRLKHMTMDKCHSRSANGPVTALVRQPAEGRARDGGLRLGEMEVDCFPEDHQLLTENGFMFLSDLEKLDNLPKFAGYDPATDAILYEHPRRLIVKGTDKREMIHVSHKHDTGHSGGVSLTTTLNHDLYVSEGTKIGAGKCKFNKKFVKMPAAKLLAPTSDMYRLKTCAKNGSTPLTSIGKIFEEDIDAHKTSQLLEFYGIYLMTRIDDGSEYVIQIGNDKRIIIDWITNSYGSKYIESCWSNGVYTFFKMNYFWKRICLSKKHVFDDWVWNIAQYAGSSVIRGIIRASGDKIAITAIDDDFRDNLVRLSIHAGISSKCIRINDKWIVSLHDYSTKFSKPMVQPHKDVYKTIHEGRVWCANMPHGFVVARRVITIDGKQEGISVPLILGNCLYAHGSMHFLKERIFDCSDGFRMFTCNICGCMANVNPDKNIYECRPCENTSSFSELRIPYAFKLLSQECEAMGIGMKFNNH